MTDELLVHYVEMALDRQLAGEQLDLAELCRDHPELEAAVRDALQLRDSLPDPEHPDPLLGQCLDDRYRLDSTLGIGAMGVVYEALDRRLDRPVAVKVLRPGLHSSPHRDERFRREAKVLATIEHPHIVSIFDHGRTADGMLYIVMECLVGVSLAAVLDQVEHTDVRAMPDAAGIRARLGLAGPELEYLPMVVAWAADLAAGLVQSHQRGIFHRDLKPSNAFVTEAGRPVLLDFGIAVRQGDDPLTMGGTTVGTPWYMAPEQAEGRETATPAVDVYGLCATLYHLVTFRPPYVGDFVEVLRQLQFEDPPPPGKLRPDLPRDLCAILEKGMARDPRHRYRDMQELESDLRAFLSFRPLIARPLNSAVRFMRRVRRRPGGAIAAVLVAAALVVGMMLTWWSQDARAADDRRYRELWCSLPALLSFEGYPDDRLLQDLSERREGLAVLDEILELRPDDLTSRLLRAALHMDHGDRQRSVADLRAIAAAGPSAYLRALVAAYEGIEDTSKATQAISAAQLPPPERPVDWFVSGFHLLRARQMAPADEHLGRAGDLLPARDLRLVTSLFLAVAEKVDRDRRKQMLQAVRAAAERLQGHYGYETARTCHVIGATYLGMGDYAAAVPHLQRALELRPGRHGPLQNLGLALRRLGRTDEAIAMLKQAHAVRPWMWNTRATLAQAYTDRGQFDLAMQEARAVPTDGVKVPAWRRDYELGRIKIKQAVVQWSAEDLAAARATAGEAFDFFAASRKAGAPPRIVDESSDFAQSIRDGDRDPAVIHLLAEMDRDAAGVNRADHIRGLAAMLPTEGLSPEAFEFLKSYLTNLAETIADDARRAPPRSGARSSAK